MTISRNVWCVPEKDLVLQELTGRELEVLRHVAAGARNRDISVELNVSVKTVEFHVANILAKLAAKSRTEAVVRAWQAGMLQFTQFG